MQADRSKGFQDVLASLNPFKGMLMLFVVMDHNNEAHALFPAVFRPLTFHVLGFLLLPFLVAQPQFSLSFVRDRIVRYSVPQLYIVTVASALFWLFYRRGDSSLHVLLDYALAVVIGSGPLIKQATGFLAYWFLPTLLGLVVALCAYQAAPIQWRRTLTIALLLAHAFLVERFFPQYLWVPFGLSIVANVFALGLVLRAIVPSVMVSRWRYAFPAAFLVAYAWLVHQDAWLEVGILRMPPVSRLATFVAHDVAAISGIITLLMLAPLLAKSRAMVSIGRHSLMIYLLHPLVYIVLDAIRGALGLRAARNDLALVWGLLSFIAALLLSWAGAILIARSRVASAWITPRAWTQWGLVSAVSSIREHRSRRYVSRVQDREREG